MIRRSLAPSEWQVPVWEPSHRDVVWEARLRAASILCVVVSVMAPTVVGSCLLACTMKIFSRDGPRTAGAHVRALQQFIARWAVHFSTLSKMAHVRFCADLACAWLCALSVGAWFAAGGLLTFVFCASLCCVAARSVPTCAPRGS